MVGSKVFLWLLLCGFSQMMPKCVLDCIRLCAVLMMSYFGNYKLFSFKGFAEPLDFDVTDFEGKEM